MYSPLWKIIHQTPSVLCTPPFEKSLIKIHRFCVLPPLKNHPLKPIWFCVLPPLKTHPSKSIGFVYSPLWKITHQNPSVLCTPLFGKSLFLMGAYFGLGVYFGKYGTRQCSWIETASELRQWQAMRAENANALLQIFCARQNSWAV